MIKTEKILICNQEGVKTYSDQNYYIIDKDGVLYPVAYDLLECVQNYLESDILIED